MRLFSTARSAIAFAPVILGSWGAAFVSAASAAAAADGGSVVGPARVAKGPWLTGLTDTGVTVRFELASPSPARVEVTGATSGADAASPMIFESGTSSMHLVPVVGLQAGKRYAYAVRVGGQILAEGHCAIAPRHDDDAPLGFIVYGDDRTDQAAHADIVRAMLQVPSDFLVNTGDMVADGGSAENWQTFFDVERPLLRDRPLLAAIGNHELFDDAAGARFGTYLGFGDAATAGRPVLPYGTTRLGRSRFFFLNGMHDWASGDERAWLERELVRADTEPGLVWRFAVVHHGPWSSGPHGGNTNLVAGGIPALLAAHKIDLLFAGHDHIYERGDGRVGERSLKYVISGGGGAPLYHVDSPTPWTRRAESAHHFVEVVATTDSVRLVAHRSDGSILERCGFARGGTWDCDSQPGAQPPAGPGGPGASPAASTPSVAVPPQSSSCAIGGRTSGLAGDVAALVGVVAYALRRRRGAGRPRGS